MAANKNKLLTLLRRIKELEDITPNGPYKFTEDENMVTTDSSDYGGTIGDSDGGLTFASMRDDYDNWEEVKEYLLLARNSAPALATIIAIAINKLQELGDEETINEMVSVLDGK